MKGCTIWFTGLSGSGKTTIANEVVKILRERNTPVVLLDGDIVRSALSPDLKYTPKDRDEQVRRIANVCYLTSESYILNISCTNSATKKERNYARSLIQNFVEVYIKCPLSVCEERDVKGYYHQVRMNKLKNFVGIDIEYEEPEKPEVILETDKETVDESVNKLIRYLEDKHIISKSPLLTATTF
jgi:adenylylsulfate kinase